MGDHFLSRNFDLFDECGWYFPMPFGTSFPVDPPSGFYLSPDLDEWFLSLVGAHHLDLPLDVAVYATNAFGQPRVHWRCLNPNRLYLDPLLGSGNFVGMPPYFDIEPFWP